LIRQPETFFFCKRKVEDFITKEMEDGWTFVAPKTKATKANKKNAQPKSKKTPKEEEPPIILNSTFDKKDSDDSDILNHKQEVYNVVYTKPEENIWQTVPSKSKRQKRKPKEKEEKPKETKKPKPKKVVEQKSEEQILKEKDERRARKEWKRGDKLLYFYAFLKQDVTATITNTTADSLIIQWEGIQQSVGRNDKSIKPIWNAKNKCYFPLPKKQKKKKAVKEQPKPKQEKKKKPKKKGPKKVTTETAIMEQISSIIQTYSKTDTLGLPEIMNHLRDHLQGGSWNQKKYKGKFGSMKKFLMKHKDRFIVRESNGTVEITRLPPPKPKLKKDPSLRGSKKPTTPRKSGGTSYVLFMLLALIVVALGGIFLVLDVDFETLKKDPQGFLKLLFSSASSNKEL